MPQVIKYSELAEYMAKIDVLDKKAQSELKKIWGKLTNYDIDEARDIIVNSMDALVVKYGDAGALLTAEFMARYSPTTFEYVIPEGTTQQQIEKSIRSAFSYWVDGAKDSTLKQLSGSLTRYIQSSSRQMVVDAAKKHKKVRFAIVPRPNCICSWCLMLGSRGFVYWSRENATSSKFHDNCKCIIVQGFEYPDGSTTQVEGYDPDMLYRRWEHITNGNISLQKGATPEDKEIDVGVFLADAGHQIKFLARSLVTKRADLEVDGIVREIKVPEGSPSGTVGVMSAHNQYKNGIGQSDKLIISEHMLYQKLEPGRDYLGELEREWENWSEFSEIWLVTRNGKIIKLKK